MASLNVIWYASDTTLLKERMKRYLDESGIGKQADDTRKRMEEMGREMNLGKFSDLTRDEKRKAIEQLEAELAAMRSSLGVVEFDHPYIINDELTVTVESDLSVEIDVSGTTTWMFHDDMHRLLRVLELVRFEWECDKAENEEPNNELCKYAKKRMEERKKKYEH